MTKDEREQLRIALETHFGAPALYGKGGFWVKDHGHISLAKARKLTGIAATPREYRPRMMYGDYATIAMINRPGSFLHPRKKDDAEQAVGKLAADVNKALKK